MRKKNIIAFSILIFGAVIGLLFYRTNYGFWPPKTAHKVISQISKIELPPNSEVLLFHEGETNFFMDDEFIMALVKFDNNLFSKALYNTGSFDTLTDSIMIQLPIPKNVRSKYFSQKGINGKYELNKHLGSTSLLLVDENRGYYFFYVEHL